MKTPIPSTFFVVVMASSLVAQQPAVPGPPRNGQAPAGAPRDSQFEEIVRDATGTATEAVLSAMKTAQAAVAQAGKASSKAFEGAAYTFGSGAKSSSRSLAIQTTSVDREKVDAIEEDLSVMARILQKAARSLRDDDRYSVMGMDVDPSLFGSASGARNIYIEGHGAIFLFGVKYPLVGPKNGDAEEQAKGSSTEWAIAQEELNLTHDDADINFQYKRVLRGKPEPYDESKVEGLKTALLASLKNASNIRHMAPEEFITVVVQGGDAVGSASSNRVKKEKEKDKDKEGRGNNEPVPARRGVQKGESVLTIRVTKADVDSYAAGKLDDAGFRQRATILTYLRRGDTSSRILR